MKMNKYIDMHCHILPGVDDGAKHLKDTKEMLEIAYQEGIRAIVATPITTIVVEKRQYNN